MTEYRWYPRAVENGLKARSSRGAIGESWWSRRFLDVLESFAMGSRLTHGRTYARKGQVISLDVLPGQVRVTVQRRGQWLLGESHCREGGTRRLFICFGRLQAAG
jgi:hypothetical protein